MADPFAAFEGRYGRQSGGGDGGDIWGNWEKNFTFARLDPSKSQKAGGLNRLNEQQLATFGYKPSDIADWNDLPERKQKKLEDILTSVISKSSPTLNTSYKPGSLPNNNVQNMDLGKYENRVKAIDQLFADTPKNAEAYTQALYGGLGRQAINLAPMAVAPFGLLNALAQSLPQTKQLQEKAKYEFFPEAGQRKNSLAPTKLEDYTPSMQAFRLAGSASKGVVETIGTGALGNVMRAGAAGSGLVKALSGGGKVAQGASKVIPWLADSAGSSGFQAVGNGGDIGRGVVEGVGYDAAFNVFTRGLSKFARKLNAPKELEGLLKSQRDMNGIAAAINDANISQSVKKQLEGEVKRLSGTLALPSPSGKLYGEGFTATEKPNIAMMGAISRLKSIEDTLSRATKGKSNIDPGRFISLKNERDSILEQINNGNLQPKPRAASNAIGDDFYSGGTISREIPTPKTPDEIEVAKVLSPDYASTESKAIKDASKLGVVDRLKDIKQKFAGRAIDDVAILENTARKANKNLTPTEDVGYGIDRVRRSDIIAQQFGKDAGLEDIIKTHGGKDFDEASIFLRDKRALELYNKSGENVANVDLGKAAKNVEQNSVKFAELTRQTQEYNQKFLDKVADYGLISRETADMLKRENPDYVPMNRVMDEVEKSFGGGSPVSLSTQNVVQAIRGSDREVKNVFENMYENMGRAVKQGERNQAAKTLASYADMEGNPFGMRELRPSEAIGNKNTFSFLDNGVKRTFEIDAKFQEAVKGMNGAEIGIIGKMFAPTARILKSGATGLNVVFGIRNVPKDQQFSTIISKHPILNIKNFFKALGDTAGLGEFGDELARYGGGTIEADVFRKMGKTVNQIRADRSVGSKLAYKAVRPNQWLRTVEDTIGKTEELTRTMNARSYYDAAIKAGKGKDEAMREAVNAYNKVSVDFLRAGSIGRQLNAVIPYLNPGIQGSRTFLKAMKERPIQTGAKLIAGVYAPMAALTAYNLADPDRREIWNDLPQFEKEGSLIMILPGAKKNSKGGYDGVIKLPTNPAFAAVNGLIAKGVEAMHGQGSVNGKDVVTTLLETLQPISSDPMKALGQLTPQVMKPAIEQFANKSLFTGAPIVGENMLSKAPNEQVKDYTSGTARAIGNMLNISPIRVEAFIKQNLAEVGSQGLNASDNILAALGKIPKEQIGGRSISAGLTGALTQARGGQSVDTFYSALEEAKPQRSTYIDKVNAAVDSSDYGKAKSLAEEYNRLLDDKLSDFNKIYKKDSSLEDALKKAYINTSDRAIKSRKSR